MASDTVVRARIDGQVKESAAKVLADMGLPVSDAIRLLLVRVAPKRHCPSRSKYSTRRLARRRRAVRQRRRLDCRAECEGLSVPLHSNATTAEPRQYPAIVTWMSGWSLCLNFWSRIAH
jgi:DNA-damage-inducible protein J